MEGRKRIYYVRHGESTTNAAIAAAMKEAKLAGDAFSDQARDIT